MTAFNRGDVATCARFYDEDATLFLPDRLVIKGRNDIEAYLMGLADSGIKLTPVEIVSIGDMGCCAGTYHYQTCLSRIAAQDATVRLFVNSKHGQRKANR